MKGKEIEQFLRKNLLPQLPDWEVRRNTMFLRPIRLCLCAVGFDTSAFDSTLIYPRAFIRPLYLQPVQDTYSFVQQLVRPRGLDLDSNPARLSQLASALREQAIPLFKTMDCPEKITAGLVKKN